MLLKDKIGRLVEAMLDGHILLDEAVSEFEKIYIEKALERNRKHLSNTAALLGIHRNTLSRKISQNGTHKAAKPIPRKPLKKRTAAAKRKK